MNLTERRQKSCASRPDATGGAISCRKGAAFRRDGGGVQVLSGRIELTFPNGTSLAFVSA
jgi:hypothetical protein